MGVEDGKVRSVYMMTGLVMTGFGIAGVFLPLLPTTPFLLVAVWCFSRSSPRLEQWLMEHRTLGPPLRDWQRDGAISARAKAIAVSLMAASYAVFYFSTDPSPLAAGIVGLILCLCALFILTRPLPR